MKRLIVIVIGALLWTASSGLRAQSRALNITLAGQSTIRSDIRVHTPSAVSTIAPLLGGDVVFTNFESTIVEPGEPLNGGRFLSPPESLDALQAMGFNLLSLANNHAFDMKVPGIQNAIREASRRNIAHAGTGNTLEEATAPAYLKTPKGTVALVAMASGFVAEGGAATSSRPGVNELRVERGTPNEDDAQRILRSIREAAAHADLVMVYQHNHIFGDVPFQTLFEEGLPERLAPPEWLKTWARAEVDAGADIVVMHGAPLVHGVEIYKGRPIFYDLGNFIFQLPPTTTMLDEPIVWESVVAHVEMQGKNLKSIAFRPIFMNKIGEGQPDVHDPFANNLFLATRGLPKPATGEKARYILQRLAESSRPFGTTISITGETATVLLQDRN